MHSEGKTMENKLVSVIVPVYNVETYLKRCITSLLAQSYTNTEIILVDDGSTDASGKICDHYAASHPSLICLHQTNQGQIVQLRMRNAAEKEMNPADPV